MTTAQSHDSERHLQPSHSLMSAAADEDNVHHGRLLHQALPAVTIPMVEGKIVQHLAVAGVGKLPYVQRLAVAGVGKLPYVQRLAVAGVGKLPYVQRLAVAGVGVGKLPMVQA